MLLPSAAVGTIFYFTMRAIFGADRAEREAQAAAEHETTQGTPRMPKPGNALENPN